MARAVPAGDILYAAKAESRGGPWTLLRAHLTRNRRFATVTTSDLSFFSFITFKVRSVVRDFKTAVVDGLSSGLTAEATPPHCANEHQARTEGYSISSSSLDTVFWCFGIEGGSRILRVVNHRRYPIAVSHPGLSVIDAGRVHMELAELSRLVSGQETIILPRDSATFGVSFPAKHYTVVRTEVDGIGWSFYQLQVGVDALLEILTRFGAASNRSATAVTAQLIGLPGCAQGLRETVGDALSKCFTPADLVKVFGWRGLLLAPIAAGGEVANFFRAALDVTLDSVNGRDAYWIRIDHSAVTLPPTAAATTETTQPTTTASQTEPASTTAPQPAQPTTGTTGPSGQSLQPGAAFDDECVVAWPTAPTRTSNAIEMTMTCQHVPESEFLFTQVVYGDPRLNVTPSTGQMRVIGKVVDIATSGYGYRELVVQASSVALP